MDVGKMPSFLYIEDHPASRLVMELLLKNVMGSCELTMLSDSQNLLQALGEVGKTFDVIFLDLHIAPLDGFEIHALLRQQPQFQDAKIVALTASFLPEEFHQVRNAGFDGLIGKPLNHETFLSYVQQLLRGEMVWEM